MLATASLTGVLPDNVEFIDSETSRMTFMVLEDRLQLSNTLMDGVSRAVTNAPENFDLFPDVKETPADVIAWMLFRTQRNNRRAYLNQRTARIQKLSNSNQI